MTPLRWAIVAGIAVGFAYTLSPLTILAVLALVPMCRRLMSGLSSTERRWVLAILSLAIALRVFALGGLFLTADPDIPYANLFGDEEFFKRRTTWLRNLGMGIPISPADYLYTFDQTGNTGYLYVLAYVQALFGLAPYGVHVMNAVFYLAATMILYRVARASFGGAAALFGFGLLLFLPSLFTWSISALKEPLYFFMVAINIVSLLALVRGTSWIRRVIGLAGFAAASWLLQSLREGGLAISLAGAAGGLTLAFLVNRPRLLLATVAALPFIAYVALSQPRVQAVAWNVVHEAAYKHWGHANTPGRTYKNLDARIYSERASIATMTPVEGGRFVVRAIGNYLTVPTPMQIDSRAALAFLPEQILWYVIALLVPVGGIAALGRDALLASIFIAQGTAVSLLVALSGGNVGTLVRHRDLSLPFFAWLAGLGAVSLIHWVLSRSRQPSSTFIASKAGLA